MSTTTRVQCLLSDQIGQQVCTNEDVRIVAEAGESGHLTYGPYEERAVGKYSVSFDIHLVEYPVQRLGDAICAVIDVVARDGSVVLARRQIRKKELEDGNDCFSLDFELAAPRVVEYRVATNGQAKLSTSAVVEVHYEPSPRHRPARRARHLDRVWDNEAAFLDGYLRNITGLIHIGANTGQERILYEILGLDVLWVEAMSDVFQTLLDNIAPYRRQRAALALLTDKEGEVFQFNVANLDGSSSLLEFDQHAEIMPDIQYVARQKIVSTTFERMVCDNDVDLAAYKGLCLDIEGSELLVLKSMQQYLYNFDYIKCEVSDFPSRVGAPTSADLDDLLRPHGFHQLVRRAFGYGVDSNGTYWDIVWKKAKEGEPLFRPGVNLPFIANDESAWEHRVMERLSNNELLPS